jgi:hypothetical protein
VEAVEALSLTKAKAAAENPILLAKEIAKVSESPLFNEHETAVF